MRAVGNYVRKKLCPWEIMSGRNYVEFDIALLITASASHFFSYQHMFQASTILLYLRYIFGCSSRRSANCAQSGANSALKTPTRRERRLAFFLCKCALALGIQNFSFQSPQKTLRVLLNFCAPCPIHI